MGVGGAKGTSIKITYYYIMPRSFLQLFDRFIKTRELGRGGKKRTIGCKKRKKALAPCDSYREAWLAPDTCTCPESGTVKGRINRGTRSEGWGCLTQAAEAREQERVHFANIRHKAWEKGRKRTIKTRRVRRTRRARKSRKARM